MRINGQFAKKREIVPIEEWLESSFYLGPESASMRVFWKNKMLEYYAWLKEGKSRDLIISGSSRSGKTYFICILILRVYYEISCTLNFPALFNLSPTTLPVGLCFSYTIGKSEITMVSRLLRMMENIPYFQLPENKPSDLTTIVRFPFMETLAVSEDTHAIGLDSLWAVLDEANVRRVNKADLIEKTQELYREVRARSMQTFSRKGVWGGFSAILSTAGKTSSFVDSELAKAQKEESCFVIQAATYDIEPEKFSDTKFEVFVGTESVPSFIIDSISDTTLGLIEKEMPYEEFLEDHKNLIEEVPTSLRQFYEEKIEWAIANISGRTRVNSSPFFSKSLIPSIFNPKLQNPCPIDIPKVGIFDKDNLPLLMDEKKLLKHYNGEPVTIHIDNSRGGDPVGFGSFFYKEELKTIYPLYCSSFEIDKKIPENEISPEKIWGLVEYFYSLNVDIQSITVDSYNANYFLSKAKLLIDPKNVAQINSESDPIYYKSFRAFLKARMISMYPYTRLQDEMRNLVWHPSIKVRNGTGLVDHPTNSKTAEAIFFKDLSDTFAVGLYRLSILIEVDPFNLEEMKIWERSSRKEDEPENYYGTLIKEEKESLEEERDPRDILLEKMEEEAGERKTFYI